MPNDIGELSPDLVRMLRALHDSWGAAGVSEASVIVANHDQQEREGQAPDGSDFAAMGPNPGMPPTNYGTTPDPDLDAFAGLRVLLDVERDRNRRLRVALNAYEREREGLYREAGQLQDALVERDAKIDEVRTTYQEADQLNGRLAALIDAVAVALKGEPEPNHMHDWSDLPAVARDLIVRQRDALASAYRKGVEHGRGRGMTGPPVPDEFQRALTKMVEARDELKAATAQAHAARRDLLHAVKEARADIEHQIKAEVAEAVDGIARGTRDAMEHAMRETISRLADDWRSKLGLP